MIWVHYIWLHLSILTSVIVLVVVFTCIFTRIRQEEREKLVKEHQESADKLKKHHDEEIKKLKAEQKLALQNFEKKYPLPPPFS